MRLPSLVSDGASVDLAHFEKKEIQRWISFKPACALKSLFQNVHDLISIPSGMMFRLIFVRILQLILTREGNI